MKKTTRRSFVFPAAVALSGHAFLLFAFPSASPSHGVPSDSPTAVAMTDLPPVVSPVDEVIEVGETEPQPAQANAVSVPQFDDVISVVPAVFKMALTTVTHADVVSDLRTLPAGWVGGVHEAGNDARRGVFEARFLDNQPRARSQMPPVYPAEMRREGMSGTVVVDFVVARDGRVHSVVVVSSTSRAFEESAVRAVERWRFAPGLKQGVPVSFRMRVPVSFSLTDA